MTVKFIAEICSNHNGDLGRAIKLINAAADIGCDGVKFQLFRIDQLFAPELLDHPDYQFVKERRQWELPLLWLPELQAACQERGLLFGCTPFYLEEIPVLDIYIDFFKVASYELLWHDLLSAILRMTDKPVIMSCGMATMAEIKEAVFAQATQGHLKNRLGLLHCISQYPVKPKDCHLSFITRLKTELNNVSFVGYSDHSVNEGVIHRAIHRYGAELIEFHLDLDDQKGNEYGQGHCWMASQIRPVIKAVRDGIAAGGGSYDPTQNPDRHFRADPGDGLRPMKYLRERLRDGGSVDRVRL